MVATGEDAATDAEEDEDEEEAEEEEEEAEEAEEAEEEEESAAETEAALAAPSPTAEEDSRNSSLRSSYHSKWPDACLAYQSEQGWS